MEDRNTGPGPEGTNNIDPASEKESVFSKHLRKLGIFGERQKENIEEDDDEETEEKPKKFRRFFKGLFRNVVQPPEKTDESGSSHGGFESLLGSYFQSETKAEQETDGKPAEASFVPVSVNQEANVTRQPEEELRISDEVQPEQEATHEPSELKTEVPDNELLPDAGEPVPERSYVAPLPVERSEDRMVFERAVSPPEIIEKEVVIERGTGMALPVVLVGAEYLSRKKADRKLDAKFTDRVERIEKENKKDSFITKELDTLVKQNREQLEALKRGRGIETKPQRIQSPEPIVARMEKPRIEQQPAPRSPEERPVQAVLERPQERETYKIMEQVAQAAERDVPVERVFERSHEVKDDQSMPVGAASVGSIVAARVASQSLPASQGTAHMPHAEEGLKVIPDHVQKQIYKQAMRNGFWAAIIIIILGTIAFLLK